MSNGKGVPRMDYGRYVYDEVVIKGKGSFVVADVIFNYVYGLMKTDPYFKLVDTFDYNAMMNEACRVVREREPKISSIGAEINFKMQGGDKVWQKLAEEEAAKAEEAELSEEETSEVEELGRGLVSKGKIRKSGDILKAIVDEQRSKGQYRRVMLKSGKWISIPK